MKKKYKNALKIGVGAAALGASNYLGKRAGEQDIAKKILASYTGDTDTVLKKTSAFGIAKPTARNKGGQIKPVKARFGDFMNTFIADDTRSVAGKSGGADSGTAGEMRSKLGKSDVVEKKKIKNYIKKKVEQTKTVIKKTKEAAKKTGTILATPIKKFHELAEENARKHGPVRIYKPRTMSKGGGMDMGAKKRYAKKNQEELFGIEITDEPQAGYTVKKTKNLSTGGEAEVMRGGDYIKDLL